MHVHVWHQGTEIIVEFENDGFNRSEERRALLIIGERQEFFQNEWRTIHG